ncbi:MAG: L-histidine N(alpha)-methyltransferase [Verrucomicrobia bacterium]|nr:L-histidine N(alpha)-methyltransferase [Verrucomicrobiota bacterium]
MPDRISDNLRMSSVVNVAIHASQSPENVRRDLLASLRTRRVNHKFHYDSIKQTQKWLALHQIYSPTRNNADCLAVYEKSFAAAAQIPSPRVHVIGLGCGGGQKDTRLLKLLRATGKEVSYTPCDVATAMVLVARQTALAVVPEENIFPFVCDLAWEGRHVADPDLFGTAARRPSHDAARLITFFGMIPNFEPQEILPRLASLLRPDDWLLFSANLAPGADYAAGVKQILPQYDNAPTREWLLTFLLDLGVERGDGEIQFRVKDDAASGLKRVVADFHFSRPRRIEIEDERFDFASGESIRLFFSYRYTPDRVRAALAQHGLEVREQWATKSGEEGVFLCGKR